MRNIIAAILIGGLFFLIGLITIGDYGISWDEPEHLRRGQAYLWYFLTGKLDYNDLPPYDLKKAQTDPQYHARSFYQQLQFYSGAHPLKVDRGHPPLADILASFFNYLFYQKLGLMGDIESYHLFYILVSAILVGLIFFIGADSFGLGSGLFASLFLATYPLFFAESHFNIKDPTEAAFFALTLYFFWKGMVQRKSLLVILSSVFAGVALGIKFNILFALLIMTLWLMFYFLKDRNELYKTIFSKKILIFLLTFLPIMFLIFFTFWPYLWSDPIAHTIQAFKYYGKVGTQVAYQPDYLLGPFNLYPIKWIVSTTQPLLLAFFTLGIYATWKLWKKHWKILSLLWLWFLIPILRVSFSGLTIYGGVRQIMEYIPAMALIAGLGTNYLIQQVKARWFNPLLAVVLIIILAWPLVKLHPYQNVYFNFLVGGLTGAYGKGLPAAGNTLGNVYTAGIDWINNHASPNSKLSLIQGTTSNIPLFKLRPDINYSNYHWSGIERGGEYLMEMTYNSETTAYYYAWEYAQKMLEPVYQVKVDEVAILKIWKNDLEHTKKDYQKEEIVYRGKIDQQINGEVLGLTLDQPVMLSRLRVSYHSVPGCQNLQTAFVESSLDGMTWQKELDWIPFEQVGRKKQFSEGELTFFLPARKARLIRLIADSSNSCVLIDPRFEIKILD